PPHPLHQSAQALLVFRRHQQMQMIRHQDIGMNSHLELPGAHSQAVEKKQVIRHFMKDHLLIDATLDHMMGLMRNDKSGKSSHGEKRKTGVVDNNDSGSACVVPAHKTDVLISASVMTINPSAWR